MAEINTNPTKVYVVINTRHHLGCTNSSCIRDCLGKIGVFYSKEDSEKFEQESSEKPADSDSDDNNVYDSYIKEVEIK